MNETTVMEYKCPCCDATLVFGQEEQKMTCQYCDNTFEIDAVKAYNEDMAEAKGDSWSSQEQVQWSEDEQAQVTSYTCNSCGGVLITDEQTAATFCPYCGNATILPGRVSGGVRPHALIPFQTTKEDAKKAFLELCKGKPLLPADFTDAHRLEKITGIYVPFWLYDCDSSLNARYKATRTHSWSDANYIYTRTEHFLLTRGAKAGFTNIPMDGSSKMDDAVMESIEPYDFSKMVDFDTAYLSGFYADKYDVESQAGHERVRQRVTSSMDDMVASTLVGYTSALPTVKNIAVEQGIEKYVLLPVWILTSRYRDKTYLFAVNGQTGKMTGTFPICPTKSKLWFAGIAAAAAAVTAMLQLLLL